MLIHECVIAAVTVVSLAACSSPFLSEGRYELATDEISTTCPDIKPLIEQEHVVVDVVEVTDQQWFAEELSLGAQLEGWFEGGGALGSGWGNMAYAGDFADTIWQVELYPASQDNLKGRFFIDLSWPGETDRMECNLVFDVVGGRL